LSRGHRRFVRLYRRHCRRAGKAGNTYKWTRIYFPIPARFLDAVKEFLDKDLKVDVKVENGMLIIRAKPSYSTL